MINKIQNSFSIQDLEILSGIKAHTIRIWEKRYALLNPTRLNRNIRVYDLLDLQKILNVTLLQKHAYKISEIAKLNDSTLSKKAKEISLENFPSNYYINSLIVSMFSYDDELFEETYNAQAKTLSFKEIFINTFLPLLNHIGVLWQTNGIKPAQERFISNLIQQKIALNIAEIPIKSTHSKEVNVLFLPEGEVHDTGLMFLNYYLKLTQEKTIYLGRDVPISDLFEINAQFQKINWICAFVINKTDEEKHTFIGQIEKLLDHTKNTCRIIGQIWNNNSDYKKIENLTFHSGFHDLIPD